jgi:predicted N-acetyltransferase YhbS
MEGKQPRFRRPALNPALPYPTLPLRHRRIVTTLSPLYAADPPAVDPPAVEALLDAAFGADRHGRTAYRLRTGTVALPALSFAAWDGGLLVGSLQSWPVTLTTEDGRAEPLILVGPIAVAPTRQKQGIGVALTRAMIAAADAAGEDALMLIGDPEYYERLFGFTAAETGGWALPGPVERRRLLARLTGDRLRGLTGMIGPRAAEALR